MAESPSTSWSRMAGGILRNRCPKCGDGAVFSGVYAMHPRCPSCGFQFERESGYFLGAVVAAYFLGAATVIPTVIVTFFVMKMELLPALGICIGQVCVLHPFLFRYSKLTWLHVENRMTRMLDG